MSDGTRYAPFALDEGGYQLGPHGQNWFTLIRRVFVFVRIRPVFQIWTNETDAQRVAVVVAWFFIRSFGPANDYQMPWAEVDQLRQFIRQCRGWHPAWARRNPGNYAIHLCHHYQPLFTVDLGVARLGIVPLRVATWARRKVAKSSGTTCCVVVWRARRVVWCGGV